MPVVRPWALSPGATASSRSRIAMSAPAAKAFAKRSGRVAGVKSQLRARVDAWSGISGLLSSSPEEVDTPTPISQYMLVASLIAFGVGDGAASHPLFPGGRGGEALHEGRCQGWDRAAATQPANQGSGGGDWNAAVSPRRPWRGTHGGGRGFPASRKGDADAR